MVRILMKIVRVAVVKLANISLVLVKLILCISIQKLYISIISSLII